MTQKSKFQSSLTHHMVRGSTIVLFFAFLAAPIGYLTRMLYSRSLSIEMFGLFYSVLAFLTVLSSFNDLGFGYSLSYLVPKFIKNNEKQKVWNTFRYDQIIEVSTAVLLSIILFFSSDFLASNYFKTPIASHLIKIFLIFFIAESFVSAIDKFFVGLQQEEYYSSIKIVKLGFSLFFSTIFFMSGRGNIIWYATSWSLAYCLTAIIYRYILYRRNRTLIKRISWDKPLFIRMFKYAVPTLLISSIGLISAPIDNFLLILFKDLTNAGIYNVILPLAIISPIFLSPINSLLLPLISKLENEPEELQLLIETMLKIVPYVAVYFALFIFLFPEGILQTVFGSKWMDLAKNPLKIASLGYILFPISSLMGTFANGLGLVKEKSKLSAILIVLKIGLSLILIYTFGIIGIIATNIILSILGAIFLGFHIKKKVSFSIPIIFYGKLLIFGFIIFAITNFLNLNPMGIVAIGIAGILYTLLYVLFGIIFEAVNKKSMSLLFENIINIKWIR